jgi:EAL domain-containing protein (putative c-di-GMP-specific phosphodiesterase class I)
LAAKINDIVAAPYNISGNEIHISASVGVVLNSDDIREAEAIMKQADLALYLAKGDGGNCFRFHSQNLDQQIRERVHVADELRAALAFNQFELFYQPQVEFASGRIVGVEVLLSWRHPDRGLIGPGIFIPLAEQTGTIVPLGRWVFDQACRQLRDWTDEGIAPDVVAVNLSAVQFKTGTDLDREIGESIARWRVPPGAVEIELTEAVLMEVNRQHTDALNDIRSRGVRIAIDNFGMGFSSFDHLSRHPVNRLKIAQELVMRAAEDPRSRAVIRASIALAAELGIELIAEGVETAAQAGFLIAAGCSYAQGVHLSEPVSAPQMTELLRQGGISPYGMPIEIRDSPQIGVEA